MSDKEDDNSKAEGKEDNQEGKQKEGRTGAEWVTLSISILIIAALVGLLTYLYFTQGTKSPVIQVEAKLEEVKQEGDAYYLPLTITNMGEKTAQDVEIQVSLASGEGDPESVGFTILFLAGNESDYETAVFSNDPAEGELSYAISFSTP
jgi:uncharacterized protein (TIGR02588 family)